MNAPSVRDAELLSAYLDGQLGAAEALRMEQRLAVDAGLRQILDDLRVASGLLKRTPRRKAPRNFTLSASDARVRAPRPLAVPVLRYAGAIAAVAFLFAAVGNAVLPVMMQPMAAAPAYGYGGGGGGGAPEEPQQALQAAPAAPAATPNAEAQAIAPQDSTVPTAGPMAKTAPPEQPGPAPAARAVGWSVPTTWVLVLAAAAVVAAGLSVVVDLLTRGRVRTQSPKK